MRLFVSLNLPDEIKLEILKIQKIFKKLGLIEGNFVCPWNLHLTIKFIGHVDDDKLTSIITALSVVDFSSFKVHLGNLGYFHKEGPIIVLWVDLAGNGLFMLANKISDALNKIAMKDSNPFLSHVTLARIKKVRNYAKVIDIINHTKIAPLAFNVKYFSLMSSKITNQGSIYEEITCFLAKETT